MKMTFSAPELLRYLVGPLVRFCLRHAVTYQDIQKTLRSEFIAQSCLYLREKGDEVTRSKLSIMTGIPRRLLPALGEIPAEVCEPQGLILNLISKWCTHPAYARAANVAPRSLKCEGAESDFAELVRSVSKELNPYTVLNELVRLGLATRNGDSLSLTRTIYSESDIEKVFEHICFDTDTLINAVEENLREKPPRHLHIATQFDNIPDKYIEKIQQWLMREGSRFHRTARAFIAQFDRDASSKVIDGTGRNTVRFVAFEHTKRSL